MLRIITDPQDPVLEFLKDDPVRPEIPREFRVTGNRFVSVLGDTVPRAVLCVSLQHDIPREVSQLGNDAPNPTTAVFYTIWSYAAGAGTRLLLATVAEILQSWPTITTLVTLSPKTDMARRFHLRNGASVYRINHDSVNYQYQPNENHIS